MSRIPKTCFCGAHFLVPDTLYKSVNLCPTCSANGGPPPDGPAASPADAAEGDAKRCVDCGASLGKGPRKRCASCAKEAVRARKREFMASKYRKNNPRSAWAVRDEKDAESKEEVGVMPESGRGYQEKKCHVCKMAFKPSGPRAEFCGDKCREAAKSSRKPVNPRAAVLPVRRKSADIVEHNTPSGGQQHNGTLGILIPGLSAVISFNGVVEFAGGSTFEGSVSADGRAVRIDGILLKNRVA